MSGVQIFPTSYEKALSEARTGGTAGFAAIGKVQDGRTSVKQQRDEQMSKPFDDNELMDQVDGDLEFLKETLAMFDEDRGELLEKIRTDATAHDAASLARLAHLMKGMLANFCAEPAETAARELETMARENRLADGEAAAERLQMETERLAEALHAFLRKQMK